MYIVIGSLALVIISILIMLVYLKNRRYGLILLAITIVFIAVNTFWSLYDPILEEKSQHRIKTSEISLHQQHLEKSYGNRYVYTAIVENHSEKYRLTSLQLQLSIDDNTGEFLQSQKTSKIWLDPQEKKKFSIYFGTEQKSEPIAEKKWQVKILSIRSK